ncbi:ESX secretion-associated protein EspG [Amycolatopsis magusensis]|uniref:ESX secretion-associated protein EspG n=1 Tax=Amycolatopsis magusensis TaxID=882444 RepID=UPI0037896856
MIRVSASAFDVLWADLGLPRAPEVLGVRSVGATDGERAEIRASVYANLAERGLYDPADGLDEALVERLRTLATASVYVECEALLDMTSDTPFRAVAAADGRHGVLATQPNRTIGLSTIRDGELLSSIVELLPALEPGPGYGVTLPASALAGGVEDPVFAPGRTAGREKQLSEVLAIQARPIYGAGQFTVRVRDGAHARRVGGVSWFWTDVGAYLSSLEPGRGGQDWVTVTPVDGPRLVQRLAGLLKG